MRLYKSSDADIWQEILIWSINQNEKLEIMKHQDIIQFCIQEDGFWSFYTPNIERTSLCWENMINRNPTSLSVTSHTPQQLQMNSPLPLLLKLKYWKSTIVELQEWESKKYTYTSVAARDLLDYCDLFEKCDSHVFLEENSESNPWIDGKIDKEPDTPSVNRIRIWINDFYQLLIDPVGFYLFKTMKSEPDELEFMKRVKLLRSMSAGVGMSNSSQRDMFIAEATDIYDEFIKRRGQNELIIPASSKIHLEIAFGCKENIEGIYISDSNIYPVLTADCFDSAAKALLRPEEFADLWKMIHDLKSISLRPEFDKEANRIWKTIIKGKTSVLDLEIVRRLQLVFLSSAMGKEIPYDCFNQAQAYLFNEMHTSSYERFCLSKYLQDLYFKVSYRVL
jgi:hypothetical protein